MAYIPCSLLCTGYMFRAIGLLYNLKLCLTLAKLGTPSESARFRCPVPTALQPLCAISSNELLGILACLDGHTCVSRRCCASPWFHELQPGSFSDLSIIVTNFVIVLRELCNSTKFLNIW